MTPLASDQNPETGTCSTQPVETMPSLPLVNVVHPSPEQSIQTATGASDSRRFCAEAPSEEGKSQGDALELQEGEAKARSHVDAIRGGSKQIVSFVCADMRGLLLALNDHRTVLSSLCFVVMRVFIVGNTRVVEDIRVQKRFQVVC